jgi:hypothetical protein
MEFRVANIRWPRRAQAGSTTILIVLMILVPVVIVLASQFFQTKNQDVTRQYKYSAQAANIAKAGLVDALMWFRRNQPVGAGNNAGSLYPDSAFSPQYPVDTADSTCPDSTHPSQVCAIGLVQEYPLTNNLIAHYEVHRQQDPATNPLDPDAVHDITALRIPGHNNGEGIVWSLESIGTILRLPARDIVGQSRVATEIRRLAIVLPSKSAVTLNDRSTVTLANNSQITGWLNYGLSYYTGNPPSISGAGSQLTGTPPMRDMTVSGGGPLSIISVFGMSPRDLQNIADVYVPNSAPNPAAYPPGMQFVFFDRGVSFTNAFPLHGSGVLYVNGDLTVAAGSNSVFTGLIFVTGNVAISGPAHISGTLIINAPGTLSMDGAGDVADVEYDDAILSNVFQQVGQYRRSTSETYVLPGTRS